MARGHRPALRLVSILGSFTLILLAIASRLVYLQVVQAAPLEDLGESQRIDEIALPAKRGAIYDRDLEPLAVSTDARAVFANPRSLRATLAEREMAFDPFVDDMASKIAPILGLGEGYVRDQLASDRGFVYLARRVAPQTAERVLDLRLPHIGTEKETRRTYPADDLAGQILGFVNVDNLGLSGMESAYNKLLSGTPGTQIIERDPQGRPIPQGRSQVIEPIPGRGVALTIDRTIQYIAEEALGRGAKAVGADAGTAIVLDARTAEVLAMANWPPLNPNEFGDATSDQRRNRAVTDVYEPGSVNKVITAAAAIEAGIATPATPLVVPDSIEIAGETFSDFAPHPTQELTYAEGLALSSNVATIKVALRLGEERLYRALESFGLGEITGIGFPGESPGILSDVRDWWTSSIGTIPIGQGIAATPLQVASVYQAIANDGVRITPTLVRGIVEPDGSLTPRDEPARAQVVSPFTAAQVRGMLVGVVEHGTGARAQIPGYLVGGKTGTARVPREDRPGYSRRIVTTFVGVAPADDPELVVLVQLDDPKIRFAALTAAPVFREIMQFALASRGVRPTVALADRADLEDRIAPRPARSRPARDGATRRNEPAELPAPRATVTADPP